MFSASFRRDSLPDLLRFPLGFSKHEHVSRPYRSLDVSSDNSSFVAALKDADTYLDDFARNSGSTYDLGNFSRRNRFFASFFHRTHDYALAPLFFS